MTQEIPIPEEQTQELSSDMVKGAGATVLTIGAAAFVNYGISFVLDYADRRIDDPAVAVPLLGSIMLMAAGKRMMDFVDQRSLHAKVDQVGDSEFDPNAPIPQSPHGLTVFNDGSVADLSPADRNSNPQGPRNR